jgi:hypothetical protein
MTSQIECTRRALTIGNALKNAAKSINGLIGTAGSSIATRIELASDLAAACAEAIEADRPVAD